MPLQLQTKESFMNLITLIFPAIIFCSALNGMEKTIEEEQPSEKQKKSSALEKAALKASKIAAENGQQDQRSGAEDRPQALPRQPQGLETAGS